MQPATAFGPAPIFTTHYTTDGKPDRVTLDHLPPRMLVSPAVLPADNDLIEVTVKITCANLSGTYRVTSWDEGKHALVCEKIEEGK